MLKKRPSQTLGSYQVCVRVNSYGVSIPVIYIFYRSAILGKGIDTYIPYFLRLKGSDTAFVDSLAIYLFFIDHTAVRVEDCLETSIHLTTRLEGVEEYMVKNYLKCVRRVVGVSKLLFPSILVVLYIHVDIHFIIDMLLPIRGILCLSYS